MKRTFANHRRYVKSSDESSYDAYETMSPEMGKFVTDTGKKTINMFKKYGLLDFYDPMAGNVAIPVEEFESVKNQVMQFIKENEGWVLGYGQQASGYEEDFWYITDWLE